LLLLLALLLLSLLRRLLGLIRVVRLILTVSLDLRRCESLRRVRRLSLTLMIVALVPALRMPIATTSRSTVALVSASILLRLVASVGRVGLVAAHATLIVAATSAEPATTRAARGRFVSGSIDADRATIEFDVIHGLDGGVGFAVLGEAHEAKAATAASIAILNHDGLLDLAKHLKLGSESHIIRVPGEAANEDLGHDEK